MRVWYADRSMNVERLRIIRTSHFFECLLAMLGFRGGVSAS